MKSTEVLGGAYGENDDKQGEERTKTKPNPRGVLLDKEENQLETIVRGVTIEYPAKKTKRI